MLADQIKKTKEFKRNFECQILDKKNNAIRSESVLNQNTVKKGGVLEDVPGLEDTF